MKKVSELSILCGVEACAIVYGQYDPEPDVWPSPSEAHNVLRRFKSMPEMEQSKKMMNQEGFLKQRIAKVKEQLKKQQRENREYEITQLMYQSLTGNAGMYDVGKEELNDLAWLIDEKMKGIQERIDGFRRMMAPQMIAGNDDRIQTGGEEDKVMLEAIQRQSWLMEVMNNPPQEQQQPVYCFGNDLAMPYGDNNTPWSNALFL
ncbi:hypothetical protein IFM89_013777 [Coptis chinensis]|uniref:MADS-box domain-containing protein n=1 Tax=Coptis chinensis TaxID=261450 RepID=A0A835LU88_9MAGN|nr:hypothetical protein IFM89_013777 [Coptis chinensis]